MITRMVEEKKLSRSEIERLRKIVEEARKWWVPRRQQ